MFPIICLDVGVTISDDEDDSDSIICLNQKITQRNVRRSMVNNKEKKNQKGQNVNSNLFSLDSNNSDCKLEVVE